MRKPTPIRRKRDAVKPASKNNTHTNSHNLHTTSSIPPPSSLDQNNESVEAAAAAKMILLNNKAAADSAVFRTAQKASFDLNEE